MKSTTDYTSKQLLSEAEDLIRQINAETDDNKIKKLDGYFRAIQETLIAQDMKYQLVISEREQKPKRILKTALPIQDVSYWQHRIENIIDNLGLNEYVTAKVAKQQ